MAVREAPLPRNWIDEALPWFRGLFGLCFVAFSANATIFIAAADLMWLCAWARAATLASWPDAYWCSGALAVMLFVGQVVTAERYPQVYRCFLAPDVVYTARGVVGGLAAAFAVLVDGLIDGLAPASGAGKQVSLGAIADASISTGAHILGWALAIPAAAILGYGIARWGEELLFGKRRRITRRRVKDEGAD